MATKHKLDFIKIGEFMYALRQWTPQAINESVLTRAELAEMIRASLDDLLGDE